MRTKTQYIVYPSEIQPESLVGSVIRVGGACGGGAHFAVVQVIDHVGSGNTVGKRLVMVNATGETFHESWGFVLRCLTLGLMTVDQETAIGVTACHSV